jgi:hypothetical protein
MSSRYLPKGKNPFGLLRCQQVMLAQHFPFLRSSVTGNTLKAWGSLRPDHCLHTYQIKIEYKAGKAPKSTIVSPVIEPSPHIHMYNDHSLCLDYRPDMPWNERTKLYQYSVPWICEWILYYELYLVNGGKWEGPESPFHLTEGEMKASPDFN